MRTINEQKQRKRKRDNEPKNKTKRRNKRVRNKVNNESRNRIQGKLFTFSSLSSINFQIQLLFALFDLLLL